MMMRVFLQSIMIEMNACVLCLCEVSQLFVRCMRAHQMTFHTRLEMADSLFCALGGPFGEDCNNEGIVERIATMKALWRGLQQ